MAQPVTKPKLVTPEADTPRDEFVIGKNVNFIREAGHVGRRQALVQKPTLRFLPGPEVFKGVEGPQKTVRSGLRHFSITCRCIAPGCRCSFRAQGRFLFGDVQEYCVLRGGGGGGKDKVDTTQRSVKSSV